MGWNISELIRASCVGYSKRRYLNGVAENWIVAVPKVALQVAEEVAGVHAIEAQKQGVQRHLQVNHLVFAQLSRHVGVPSGEAPTKTHTPSNALSPINLPLTEKYQKSPLGSACQCSKGTSAEERWELAGHWSTATAQFRSGKTQTFTVNSPRQFRNLPSESWAIPWTGHAQGVLLTRWAGF